MAEQTDTYQPKTLRELAAAVMAADNAQLAAYRKTQDLTQTAEERIDAFLAYDDATRALVAAKVALGNAPRVAA